MKIDLLDSAKLGIYTYMYIIINLFKFSVLISTNANTRVPVERVHYA